MALVSDVLDRLVTILEATTVDTSYDGSSAFEHIQRHSDDDLLDVQSPTRLFRLDVDGGRQAVGPMGATVSPIYVQRTINLQVYYTLGDDAWSLEKVIAEDVDRLAFQLEQPGNWNTPTDVAVSSILVGSYSIEAGEAQAGAAMLTIPVEVIYRPSFTG